MTRSPTDDEFAELVQASWGSLYRTAYLILGDHGLAEDLVQTSLARTYAAWRRVRSDDAAPAYARTTQVNTAAEWIRKRSWRRELPTETLTEPLVAGSDPTLRPTVLAALGQLAPRQRAVVVLRYYEDLSVAETARVLGCSEGTVKSQTHAALQTLRTHLGDSVLPLSSGSSS
jgi:RNA polymerase sigma-70 factor (sigma-E family)